MIGLGQASQLSIFLKENLCCTFVRDLNYRRTTNRIDKITKKPSIQRDLNPRPRGFRTARTISEENLLETRLYSAILQFSRKIRK